MTDSEKLDLILEKVNEHDRKFESIDSRFDSIDSKLSSLDNRLGNVETDLQEVKQRVTYTELIVENEIRPNIMRVAEGHLDLSRKLDDYIKVVSDVQAKQEIHDIYIKMHDVKLRAI